MVSHSSLGSLLPSSLQMGLALPDFIYLKTSQKTGLIEEKEVLTGARILVGKNSKR